MDTQELIEHAKRIRSFTGGLSSKAAYAEAVALLTNYAGPRSSFLELLKSPPLPRESDGGLHSIGLDPLATHVVDVLGGFIDYLEAGLHEGVSPERRAQLDVVSDFLAQADTLLETKDVHPAAPAVLIGATLEEFLRTWVETEGLNLGDSKPGLEAYTQLLYAERLIKRQDVKDITSWGGIRNHAAHGEWEEVGDKRRVALMLEGVNLFMRKYSEA